MKSKKMLEFTHQRGLVLRLCDLWCGHRVECWSVWRWKVMSLAVTECSTSSVTVNTVATATFAFCVNIVHPGRTRHSVGIL